MSSKPSAIERAFQLAKSTRCSSVRDIAKALKMEGYTLHELEQLSGVSLRKQLQNLIRQRKQGND
jgi:hypothetical protein